jgi:hypothetical protein
MSIFQQPASTTVKKTHQKAATASVSKLKDRSEALQLEHSRNVAVFFLACKVGIRPKLGGCKHQSDSFADVCGNGPRLPG